MRQFFKSPSPFQIAITSTIAVLATVTIVFAASTIGDSIVTTGTLEVTDTATLHGALGVTGKTTLVNGSSTAQTITSLYFATASSTGAAALASLSVVGNTALTGTLAVTGNTLLSTASSTGIVQFSDIQSTTGSISFDNENLVTTGTFGAHATTITGALGVTGDTSLVTASSTGLVKLASASSTLASFGSNGTTVTGLRFGTCAGIGAGSYTAGTSTSIVCTATGVTSSDKVFVTPPNDYNTTNSNSWLIFTGATASTTADKIDIQIFNASSTANITGAARTWAWMAIR